MSAKVRPEQGLLTLRKTLGLYANIRPANLASESLLEYSPLRPEIASGVDMIVVRELIGGVYFGARKEQNVEPDLDTAWDTMIYSVAEVQRITRVAAQIALSANPPLEIHSIDKANVLASSRLWRKVVTETLTKEYPQLKLNHNLVDSAAMVIVSNPKKMNGVILTENLFGDMCVLNIFDQLSLKQMIQLIRSVKCNTRITGSSALCISCRCTLHSLRRFQTHHGPVRADPRLCT